MKCFSSEELYLLSTNSIPMLIGFFHTYWLQAQSTQKCRQNKGSQVIAKPRSEILRFWGNQAHPRIVRVRFYKVFSFRTSRFASLCLPLPPQL
ncbi:hypothetical protein V6N11_035576 [Hibiscus sabdariffa]|uniref:Uncharacterized protein n=1 Tax=Hibiscus sabdariffa TaxID=183260 RepID=A0ABR2R0U6_9ROSI